MSQNKAAAKKAIKLAKAEVALSKKLLNLLNTPDVQIFFKANHEFEWGEMDAECAWEFWVKCNLTAAENEIYQEKYAYNYSDISDLQNQIAIDSNRVPCGWNPDGY